MFGSCAAMRRTRGLTVKAVSYTHLDVYKRQQSILGDGGGFFLRLEEIEHAHAQAPNNLLKKPFFSTVVKRSGRSSPSSLPTASSYALSLIHI